jgi:hypothetical protein
MNSGLLAAALQTLEVQVPCMDPRLCATCDGCWCHAGNETNLDHGGSNVTLSALRKLIRSLLISTCALGPTVNLCGAEQQGLSRTEAGDKQARSH